MCRSGVQNGADASLPRDLEGTNRRVHGLFQLGHFVATLGASSYTYAEAAWTQALPDWIGSHIFGAIRSVEVGSMQLKADGWSGAGRMFRGHEYESGALYIQISDYTGSSLVLSVEGYGSFPFRRTRC